MTRGVAGYVASGASVGLLVGLAARQLINKREPSLSLPPQGAMAGARLLPVSLVDLDGRFEEQFHRAQADSPAVALN